MKRAYDSSRVAYKDNIKSREEAYTMVGKSSVKRTSVMEYTNGVGTRTYKRDMSKYKDRGTPRDYTESDTYKKFNPEQKAAYKKAQMKKGIYTPAQLKKASSLTPSAQMKEYGAVLVGGTATRIAMEAKVRKITPTEVKTMYSMTPKARVKRYGAEKGLVAKEYKQYQEIQKQKSKKQQVEVSFVKGAYTLASPAVAAKMGSAIREVETQNLLTGMDTISSGGVPDKYRKLAPRPVWQENIEKSIIRVGGKLGIGTRTGQIAVSDTVIGGMVGIQTLPQKVKEIPSSIRTEFREKGIVGYGKEVGKGALAIPQFFYSAVKGIPKTAGIGFRDG